MNRCTVLLATQRSGSTFLERCLSSVETAGKFGEFFIHFLDMRGKFDRDYKGSPAAFMDALKKGHDVSGNYGMTQMASYLPDVAAAYFGRRVRDDEEWQQAVSAEFLNALKDYFDDFNIIFLKRNVVQQGVSEFMARNTGMYHVVNGDHKTRDDVKQFSSHEDALEAFDPKFVIMRARISIKENQFLEAVVARLGINPVHVDYEDVVNDTSVAAQALMDAGFIIPDDKEVKVSTKKVVNPDTAKIAAQKIADHLGLDNWTWDTLEAHISSPDFDGTAYEQIPTAREKRRKKIKAVKQYISHRLAK